MFRVGATLEAAAANPNTRAAHTLKHAALDISNFTAGTLRLFVDQPPVGSTLLVSLDKFLWFGEASPAHRAGNI